MGHKLLPLGSPIQLRWHQQESEKLCVKLDGKQKGHGGSPAGSGLKQRRYESGGGEGVAEIRIVCGMGLGGRGRRISCVGRRQFRRGQLCGRIWRNVGWVGDDTRRDVDREWGGSSIPHCFPKLYIMKGGWETAVRSGGGWRYDNSKCAVDIVSVERSMGSVGEIGVLSYKLEEDGEVL
ncbi:hypothetical protein Tco_0065899 [Tanacetum coccineum]